MDGINVPLIDRMSPGIRSSGQARRIRWSGLRRWTPFLVVVVVPSVATATYLYGFASPQYVSETAFVVRGQATQPTGMLSSLLLAGSGSSASEDTYAVQDYLTSRDAAKLMLDTEHLRSVFGVRGADRLARFPSLMGGDTFEAFYRYYKRHVVADLDTSTSISTLKVRTFRASDSQAVATALISAAEGLINRMNLRARENAISSAAKEVAESEAHLRLIERQLAAYRNEQALLDPLKQSVPMLKRIEDLQALLTSTSVQLAQLETSAPSSPLIPVFRRRELALENQIAESSKDVTGSPTSMVPKITAFDDLRIQQELAEKDLAATASALVAARAQADRQQLYLEEISSPDRPDYAAYPESFVDVLTVLASCFGLFLMGRLIVNGAREHQIV